jgi:DNA-binding LacI/PurR family transcriptional regulator
MPPATPVSRKPSPKQDLLVQHLRERIVAGTLPPGARLPTRAELEERFAVSSVTVQRALDVLIGHGFVAARGTLGTFVSDRPPHLGHHAVVFFARPNAEGWMRFRESLRQAATALGAAGGRRVTAFYCSPDASGERQHAALCAAIAAQALAGVIFTSHPYPLAGSPALEAPGLPRVALMPPGELPGLKRVTYDEPAFLRLALARLRAAGCRRVALLTVPAQHGGERLEAELAAHGLEAPAHWRLTVHPSHAESARACIHLLLHGDNRRRPDGLLVGDDNLFVHALAGIGDAGLRIPADLAVVAHANFPDPLAPSPGVLRLGYDARTTLATCLQLIDDQRAGLATPAVTRVAPVFADRPDA